MWLTGGVHAHYNVHGGPELDPSRSRSLSASAAKLAKQSLPDWLHQQGSLTPSSPPTAQGVPVQPPSSTHSRMTERSQHHLARQSQADKAQPSQACGTPTAAQIKLSSSTLSRPGSVDGNTSPASLVQVADNAQQSVSQSEAYMEAAGSDDKFKAVSASNKLPQAVAASLTPFSAFAQRVASCTSSGTGDSDGAEQLGTERQRSCSLALPRRSGSFGGRGAALGYMMAAQQQWRQDSFSKAREQRRTVENSWSSSQSPPQDSQAGRGSSTQQPGINSGAKASEKPAWRGKLSLGSRTTGKAGSEKETSPAAALDSNLPASASRAQQQLPQLPHSLQSSGTSRSEGTKPASSVVSAILNPFLAAAQSWQKSRSSEVSDASDHSDSEEPHGPSALPSCAKPSGEAAASAADSAAVAERWLAARQESLDQSGQSEDWSGSEASQAAVSRPASNNRALSGRDLSRQNSSQTAGGSLSKGLKAGPPPDKGSFQNCPSAFHKTGTSCTSS